MKNLKLLPNVYKKIGWFIFIPALIGGIIYLIFYASMEKAIEIPFIKIYNTDELFSEGKPGWFVYGSIGLDNIIPLLLIIGGILVGFSREKHEDEYINSLRLKSMFWSIFVSYCIIFVLYFFSFNIIYFQVSVFTFQK